MAAPHPDNTAMLDCALSLIQVRKWQIFPLHTPNPANGLCTCGNPKCGNNAGKHPRTANGFLNSSSSPDQIRQWWTRWSNANIGVCTGKINHICVLDVDPRHDGDKSLKNLELKYGKLPSTFTVRTGGGGFHFYFSRWTGPKIKSISNALGDEYPGLDTKGEGGYTVGPGSLHLSGRRYEIINDVTLVDMPEWLEALLISPPGKPGTKKTQSSYAAPEAIPEGVRDDTFVQLATSLANKNIGDVAVLAALREVNRTRCSPPYDDGKIADIVRRQCDFVRGNPARSLARAPTKAPAPEITDLWEHEPITRRLILSPEEEIRQEQMNNICREYPRTDLGNSQRFVLRHGLNSRYCHAFKSWFVWDTHRWKRDDRGHIRELAKDTVLRIADEAGISNGATEQSELFKWAGSSQARNRIDGLIDLSRSSVSVTPDQLDTNPDLLNFQNGTLNLLTFEFSEPRRDDLITKTVGCSYDPTATCPKWDLFLNTIMAKDEKENELIKFLQRAAGYSLTGHTGERAMFLCHGSGANGKSTFLNTLLSLMGDYGKPVESSTFCISRNEPVRNDLAALKGSRFVSSTEAAKGKRLDEDIIKQLTGGTDMVRARFLFQEFFEFKPECKIWWAFNSAPRITDSTDSIWSRVKLIPFSIVIEEKKRDKHLFEKLLKESQGIMNWMIAGLREYYKIGLSEPEEVKYATQQYREDQDSLADFLEDVCVVEAGATVGATDLYNGYKLWMLQAPEEKVKSPRAFGFEMNDRNFKRDRNRDTKRKEYTGIRLKNLAEKQQNFAKQGSA
jgi:putative DNA primase/helicase